MDILNRTLSIIFEIIFYPFTNLNPIWAMIFVSFITGIVMLFIFKKTSDQKGIKKAKNIVKAHFLAIALYRDDFTVMIDTLKNIILSNLYYMKKSLRPMLFLIIPVSIILIQIGARYEYRPLQVGETTVISLILDSQETDFLNEVQLDLPDGLILDIPPVRVSQLGEINWRITAKISGDYNLTFKVGDKEIIKHLHVTEGLKPISPNIARDNLITKLMNPAESSLPGDSFASMISVSYPKREFRFIGLDFHWLIAFFLFSMIAAFSFKSLLRVEV